MITLRTHIPEVEGDFQVIPEMVRKLRVHVQHLQDVLSEDLVEVAVGQRPHVGVGLARSRIQVDGLAEDVVLPWRRREKKSKFQIQKNDTTSLRI